MRLLPLFLWHLHLLCWVFCISGIFSFAMQCVLHIYIILDLYLFLAAPFLLQCVLSDSSLMITYQLLYYALFCCLNCRGLQCILQCNAMCCSALQCSLHSFHCCLLTYLIFLFYSIFRLQFIHIDTCLEYLNYLSNTFNLHIALYLA